MTEPIIFLPMNQIKMVGAFPLLASSLDALYCMNELSKYFPPSGSRIQQSKEKKMIEMR